MILALAFYDPTLGRWFNVDPKLEFVSPYGYCANNPVLYIDPNGEDIVLTISKEVTDRRDPVDRLEDHGSWWTGAAGSSRKYHVTG